MLRLIALLTALPLAAQDKQITSLLGKPLHSLEDRAGSIRKADAALVADPSNIDLLIAAGRARDAFLHFNDSIRLYTHGLARAPEDARLYALRGQTYLSVRGLDDAVADLKKADELAPAQFDTLYHLALAYYLRGDYVVSAETFARCSAIPNLVMESRIPLTNWRYAALRLSGKHEDARMLLDEIPDGLQPGANEPSYRALLFLKGVRTEEEVLDPKKLTASALPPLGYAVANFLWLEGKKVQGCALLRRVVETPYWSALGYIAAEVDLAVGRCGP